MNGFLKLNRSPETEALMKKKNAFMLLTQIAYRARRTNEFNTYGLTAGQAQIGDHDKIGLTEREYRTAKKKLEKWNFATFKRTNWGTIATITSTKVYDINSG